VTRPPLSYPRPLEPLPEERPPDEESRLEEDELLDPDEESEEK